MKISDCLIEFVTGRISYEEFGNLLDADPEIWREVQSLLTDEIIADPQSPFWTAKNRSVLEANSFSVRAAALAFGYGNYGQMMTHSLISDLVEYTCPGIQRRSPPVQSAESVIEKIGLTYLGGREVDSLIRSIVCDMEANTAKERMRLIKETLCETFHILPRRKPVWIQEPEWPMGTNSPMQFICQKQTGELVCYTFMDVDTGEKRIIEQLY